MMIVDPVDRPTDCCRSVELSCRSCWDRVVDRDVVDLHVDVFYRSTSVDRSFPSFMDLHPIASTGFVTVDHIDHVDHWLPEWVRSITSFIVAVIDGSSWIRSYRVHFALGSFYFLYILKSVIIRDQVDRDLLPSI